MANIKTKKTTTSKKKKTAFRKKALEIKKKRRIINTSLSVLLFLIIVSGSLMIYVNSVEINENSPLLLQKLAKINNKVIPEETSVAALVNEQEILSKDVDLRYNLLPPQYKQLISRQDVLNQMIDETLLLQEADNLGIVKTEETVLDFIQNLSIQKGTTMEEFIKILENNGLTFEEAQEFYRKTLVLNDLVTSEIFTEIEVTKEDIETYYELNEKLFTTPKSINVSHILVCHNESLRCLSNLTFEEARERSEEIKELLTENNFGELALKYSAEPAAQFTLGNLGWVSEESPFDRDFLNATFELKKGEVSNPVETAFGFHLIKVFDIKKAESVEIDVVKDQINLTLSQEQQRTQLLNYINGLKNESNIIIYE